MRRLALIVVVAMVAMTAVAVAASSQSASVSSSVDLPGATATAVSGNYAYVTASSVGRVTAVNISNPSAPTIAGESASSNALVNASNIAISGGYAYVVSKNRNGPQGSNQNDDGTGNALTILDIASNPAQPTIVGSVHDATNLFGGYGIAVSGGYAYVAAQGCLAGQPCPNPNVGNSFAVVNVSVPSNPTVVATLHNNSLPAPFNGSNSLDHPTSVAISGNYAYVTSSYSNRLTVIDISNPLSPTIVASLNNSTKLDFDVDVTVSGTDAYVANQVNSNQLAVVDISNPRSPQVLGTVSSSSLDGAYRVKVRGNFAYISGASANAVGAVDISNPAAPRLAGSDIDSAHLFRTTGLDANATGSNVIANSPYLSSQSAPLYPPFANQPGGTAVTGTVTDITVDSNPLAVTITPSSEPANPTTQTGANFKFAMTDNVATARCQLDAAPFSLCTTATSQQYTGLSGGSHTFTVEAIGAAGNTATASYTWTVNGASGGGPQNSSVPTIQGSAVEGQTLTATTGNWSGSPTYAYQWERCSSSGASCNPITTATGALYTVLSGDVGSTLEAVVTATENGLSSKASSKPTAVVTSAPGPLTPLLDNFNQPDNSGPPDANWSSLAAFNTPSSNNLFISGQQVASPSGQSGDYWNPQQFGPNSEAWVTVATKPAISGDTVYLGLRYQSPGSLSSSGYQAAFFNESGTDQYKIALRTNGSGATILSSTTGPELAAGDQLLFRAIGTTLELWRGSGGVWTRILTASSSAITSPGYIALVTRDTTVRLDNFGGGTLP